VELWLIRHAPAEPTPAERRDAERALKPAGAHRFARAVRGMRRLDLRFERVLHSPLLRALQTADLLRPVLDGRTEVTPWLSAPPGDALLALVRNGPAGRTALVGHEPHLSQLAAWLTLDGATHEAIARADLFRLQKGGVVHLAGDLRPGGMTLIGFLPPRLLERIGS
jgi:phosphohistidine phosphatase